MSLILQPLSESELIDELSEDFDQSKCKEKQSKPTERTEVCFFFFFKKKSL